MRPSLLFLCLAVALPGSAAAQVSAEPWFRGGTWMLTVEAGGAAFSDFERTQARPVSTNSELGDFQRRVSARTAGSAGIWASYWLRDGWAIRAGAGYVPSSFTVWNDDTAHRAFETSATAVEGDPDPSYASLDIWLAHAALVVRFPRSFGRVAPYGIAGGGLIRYDVTGDAEMPPEARGRFAEGDLQTGAVMFGVGAAIPLQRRNLLMSFELTNHLSRSPLGPESAGELFDLHGVSMQLDPDPNTSGEHDVGVTSHLRLALGLTLPLR
jgi:hypothetical protein